MSTTTSTTTVPAPHKQVGTFTRVMRVLYVVFAWVLALCLLIQVFLAGLGIFGSPSLLSLHTTFIHYFEFLPLLLILLALMGRTRHALVWWSLLLQVQIELQYFFAHAPVSVVAALHPVNAVLMFWITIHVARRGRQFLKQG
jgi:mercuric ion transport protein